MSDAATPDHAPPDHPDPRTTHRYHAELTWSGSTAEGYERYSRSHAATAPPAHVELALSADAAFRGDAGALNPEQLLLLAASSCQMLSFLAIAARARVDVVAYADRAEALMPEDDHPTRITRIDLRPHITVRAGDGEVRTNLRAQLDRFVALAHEECYIANTVLSTIVIEPTFDLITG